MSKSFGQSDPRLAAYAEGLFRPIDPVLAEIRERSARDGLPQIHVAEMDGLHLEVLTRGIGARRVVEIGTLAGFSGVCIARGLQPGGHLHTFEFEPRHAEVAAESFRRAGVADRVTLHVGSAVERLPGIEKDGPFDLVFIDADKVSYPQYLEWAWRNLRLGGVVLGDNTFGWGLVADDKFDDPEDELSVRGIQKFNRATSDRARWRATILPTGEGLTMAVKVS